MSDAKQLCCLCREPIAAGATICKHCDSYQDFRRYINPGNSALALVVALLSVLTLGIPPILTAVSQIKSQVEDVFVGVSNYQPANFTIYAYNDGSRFGVLSEVAFLVANTDGGREREEVIIRPGNDRPKSDLAVSPGAYTLLRVIRNTKDGVLESTGRRNCALEYVVSSASDRRRMARVGFDCP